MDDQNGNIDISIIILYFCVVLLVGYLIGRKARTGGDFFLGGRSLFWGFIAFSLCALDKSSTTLVGLAGAAIFFLYPKDLIMEGNYNME